LLNTVQDLQKYVQQEMCLFVANTYCALNIFLFLTFPIQWQDCHCLHLTYWLSLHILPQNKNINASVQTFHIHTLPLLAVVFFHVKMVYQYSAHQELHQSIHNILW